MALKCRVWFFLLLVLVLVTLSNAQRHVAPARSRARVFIISQCKTTLYPGLCMRYLLYYVNNFTADLSHQQLAQFAIKVTLVKAQSTRAYVTAVAKGLEQKKANNYNDVKECLDQINDGVDQLTNSLKESQYIKQSGDDGKFPWHASNIITWLSTALTDASTCINGFSGKSIGGKNKAMIRAKVVNLEQTTSIALALFNRFAARYSSSHVKRPKV